MISNDYLNKAIDITSGPREDSYGNKIKNHCNIASLWSAYLGREITARDVSLILTPVVQDDSDIDTGMNWTEVGLSRLQDFAICIAEHPGSVRLILHSN